MFVTTERAVLRNKIRWRHSTLFFFCPLRWGKGIQTSTFYCFRHERLVVESASGANTN